MTQQAVLYKQRFDLGNGLELWQVDINDLHEQKVNARAMSPDAFKQLSENIAKRGALESMPLCALIEGRLEIISGHHRARAARKAGVLLLWVLVDVTGLTKDAVKAKQLAHNSIQGIDNDELVQKIFADIESVDARIEAFIQPVNVGALATPVDITTKDLDVFFETKTAVIQFLPAQFAVFKEAILKLRDLEPDEIFLATLDEYDLLITAVDKTSEAFEIRSVPTIFAKMAEMVLAQIEAKEAKTDPAAA